MRSSLVFAALGISLIACGADESRSPKSAWECAPLSVRNGETVTCTKETSGQREVATNDPQAPSGGLFVRSFQVPPGSGSESSESGSGTSGGATSGGPAPAPAPSAESPSAPAPAQYDCSVAGMNGENCPPKEALPAPPAPAAGTPAAPPGSTSAAVQEAATDYRCDSTTSKTTCTRKTIECKEGTMQVGEECLAIGEAPTTAPASVGCTLTQGYWKNHAEKWPTQVLTIGGVSYTQAQLLAIFNTPPSGDASLIIAHQLIAAMLNAATGASTTEVGGSIQAAQAWMSANKDADGRLPYGVASTSPAGAEAVAISAKLDTYNNGGLGPAHCD